MALICVWARPNRTELARVAASSFGFVDCTSTGMMLVVPGDPDNSLLYLKLTTAPCGDAMPPTGSGALPADAIELVRQWILAGAKKD